VNLDPIGAVIKAALLAGVVAGLVVAAVQFVWTEPLVDRAIVLEAELHHGDAVQSSPVVDRPTQKKGLFLAYTLYGVAWGLLFGAGYAIAQPHLPGSWGRFRRSLLVAVAAYWAVGLLPFLKYPANPPGVGDPDTIDVRQRAYLAMLVGGIFLVAIAYAAARRALPRLGRAEAAALGLAVLAAGSALLFWALPGNPDEIRTPMAAVTDFRVHSLAGITLFWLLVGGGYALSQKLLTGHRNHVSTI
jgi:predicted cobalt transporter CbtA